MATAVSGGGPVAINMPALPNYDDSCGGILSDKKYLCCCGNCHVEKAAYVIALIESILSVAGIIALIFVNPFSIPAAVVALIVYGCIVIAHQKRNPNLYLPYIIIEGISLVLCAIGLVGLIVAAVWVGVTVGPNDDRKTMIAYVLGGVAVVMAICLPIKVWLYSVIWRAWKYLKAERCAASMLPVARAVMTGAGH